MMKILIATNHLQRISGSEVVALEFATYFQRAGHAIDVYANWAGQPMADIFQTRLGRPIITNPEAVRPLSYDFAYIQHQVAGLFAYEEGPGDLPATAIAFGRLSRRSFMESGGWAHDNALGDVTVANSELTAQRLGETGIRHPVWVSYNPAPGAFHAAIRPLPDRPRRILVVSNHDDRDLLAAVALLRGTTDVLHIGRTGDEQRLVSPVDIGTADVVVSIGKSIQYALASHTPAYVYDRFGGPGYLDAGNFEAAALANFSGRCCETRRTPAELVADIMDDYGRGRAFAQDAGRDLGRYRLEPFLDRLLALPPRPNSERRADLLASRPAIELERMMALHVRETTIRIQNLLARHRPKHG